MTRAKVTSGFTIVELLIVIVVIGILASIVIVAYRGVREGAVDAKRSAAIDQYAKIISVYGANNKSKAPDYEQFDDVSSEITDTAAFCIGEKSDYPATDHFAEGQCAKYGESSWAEVSVKFNDEMRKFSDTIPDGSYPEAKIDAGGASLYIRGVYVRAYVNYGSMAQIEYYDTASNGKTCASGELYNLSDDGIDASMCALVVHW